MNIMKLYFKDSKNQYRLIENNVNEENAFHRIKSYVYELNPSFQIYYIRSWMTSEGKCFDVGSHTEFFYLTNQILNK